MEQDPSVMDALAKGEEIADFPVDRQMRSREHKTRITAVSPMKESSSWQTALEIY